MNPVCKCGKKLQCFTVRKDGPNTGRKFYTCSYCNFFQWNDVDYDCDQFINEECYRCGRWGCGITECIPMN